MFSENGGLSHGPAYLLLSIGITMEFTITLEDKCRLFARAFYRHEGKFLVIIKNIAINIQILQQRKQNVHQQILGLRCLLVAQSVSFCDPDLPPLPLFEVINTLWCQ